ncbi:MAG: type I DNA topoisomerase [Planctomycetaceae bacterium]|nr:type I DNA topoisomerase [Planctomycetaceae bacterium]
MKHLVIVESPTKAKKIKDYLGKDYVVEASFGHVRDLPQSAKDIPEKLKKEPWARLGIDVDHGFAALYIVPDDKKAQISKLKKLVADADHVYLATDEDREGEAIAWHLLEVLKPTVPVSRMVFNEITKEAIQRAVSEARELDKQLVRAQEARRILDRLYGYEVSPVLWRKISKGLSAGRVQSVATKLLVEREKERMAFVSATWWDVDLGVKKGGTEFEAELVSIAGRKLARGSDFTEKGQLKAKDAVVLDEAAATKLGLALTKATFAIEDVKRESKTSSPRGPFTTSTFQQDAGRKLGLRAQEAMRIAQRLYEGGYITYMRTDSTALSGEAIEAARTLVAERYGPESLPPKPRFYGNQKSKGAQEAHEAIRPAGSRFRLPEEVGREVSDIEARVYDLIWKRTVACQMVDERFTVVTATMASEVAGHGKVLAQSKGRTTEFAGYRRAYVEGVDDVEKALDERERVLPPLERGDRVDVASATPSGHRTTPPSRFTEALLVKRLEELGIGRPSTYASIIETITNREYAISRDKTLIPTWLAFAVVHALELLEPVIVDYAFTASMEEELDRIASGELDQQTFLNGFWSGTKPGLKHVVATRAEGIDPREVGSIRLGLHEGEPVLVRVGRYGPYVQSKDRRATVPTALAPDELTLPKAIELLSTAEKAAAPLGFAADGRPVYVRNGRFGYFVQLGDDPPAEEETAKPKKATKKKSTKSKKAAEEVAAEPEAPVVPKPKRASLFKGMKPESLSLDEALALLSLPRALGPDPRDGRKIAAKNGRFGPYLEKEPAPGAEKPEYRRVGSENELLTVTLEAASALFAAERPARTFGRRASTPSEPIATLGPDPTTQRPVIVKPGKYGPYVTDGETNATIPKGEDPKSMSLERAAALLAQKRAAGPVKKKRARRS